MKSEHEADWSELEIGPSRLEPRGGLLRASVEHVLAPRTPEQASVAFRLAQRRAPASPITLIGARRSFEAHFVPPDGDGIAVSSERLRGVQLSGKEPGLLRVRALAGTSFGELLDLVRAEAGSYMPFSAPTAEAISLGGAFAANTHSRSSDTYGGFFADRVTGFRLVVPGGRVYECSENASTEIERSLYRYVPGALGALGLVTDMDLELRSSDADSPVVVRVLESHRGDPLSTVAAYEKLVQTNRVNDGFRFGEGVGAVFFGPPRSGRSLVLARERQDLSQLERATLPLFDEHPTRNAVLQALLHRFPGPAQWLTPRLLRKGRSFNAGYRRWTFFQSSWDEAAERLKGPGFGWRALSALLGVDPRLTLVHQSWVIPRRSLGPFMQTYFELLESRRFRPLAAHFELQDLVPIPQSRWPLGASYRHPGGSHVLTLNCPVRGAPLLRQARQFCTELSRHAHASHLGVVVHLVKQLHLEDALLREMYAEPLRELRALKREVDPHNILRSRTLDRLGFGAP